MARRCKECPIAANRNHQVVSAAGGGDSAIDNVVGDAQLFEMGNHVGRREGVLPVSPDQSNAVGGFKPV